LHHRKNRRCAYPGGKVEAMDVEAEPVVSLPLQHCSAASQSNVPRARSPAAQAPGAGLTAHAPAAAAASAFSRAAPAVLACLNSGHQRLDGPQQYNCARNGTTNAESVRRRFTPQKKASRGAAPARAAGRSRRRAVALSAVRSGHDAPHAGKKKGETSMED